ncbi:MAG: hypothetical protein ABII85_01795 [Bacillota bacterium]
MNEIDTYKSLFTKMNKSDLFEINKKFIEDIVDTEQKIKTLSEYPQIKTNPRDQTKQRITEAAKQIVKLKQVHAAQIQVLNKILGSNSEKKKKKSNLDEFISEAETI